MIKNLNYFKYFKNIVGWHIYGYLILNFLVGLMDGLGLTMFVPLLAIATKTETGESLGKLQFVVDFIEKIGLELNLTTALLLMISIFILKGIFYYIRTLYFTKLRLKGIRTIRLRLASGLRNLSYSGFTDLDAGTIQNNMVGQTARLIGALSAYFTTIQHIIMLTTYVVLALMSNWQFAIMVAIGGIVTNVFYQYVNKITVEYARKQIHLGNDFNSILIQSINYFKYLKATNLFKKYETKLRNNITEDEEYGFKMSKIGAIAESLREPMIIIIISIVILIQIEGMGGNFASIMVSLLLFYRALAHLVSMQNSWNSFLSTATGIDSVEGILEDFKKYEEPTYTDQINKIQNIDVKNISINFGNHKVLKNINFSIPNKTSVALVGESGAGKTTLANIICGLQPPNSGNIVIDNKNLYETDLNIFREKVGYITQEAVIFDDTIFNNVTFWAEKTPENYNKFIETMKIVSMQDFVNKLEHKEDSRLGNNGILISGGQKQRISIARELYKDVELLIMDEATSALDSETEKHIKENIDMLHGKFTIIIIAHRLSTIKNVDTIYLLENGELSASGNFNELTNKSDKFKKMVELQNF